MELRLFLPQLRHNTYFIYFTIFLFIFDFHIFLKIFDARHMRKPRAGFAFVVFWLLVQLLLLLAAVEKCSLWLKRTAATRATS